MKWTMTVAAALLVFASATGLRAEDNPLTAKKFVRIGLNHMVDDQVTKAIELVNRSAKAGYNGVVVA